MAYHYGGRSRSGVVMAGGCTRFQLRGYGVALPEDRLDNLRLGLELGVDPESIEQRTGILERRIARDDESASTLGALAATAALSRAHVDPLDIDLVLLSTYTPDRLLCPTGPELAYRIGAIRAGAFDLNGACSGGVAAILTAASLVNSGAFRNILVVTADLTTRYVRIDDPKTRLIFGDGAAAVIVSSASGATDWSVLASSCGADGSGAEFFAVESSPLQQGINGWTSHDVPAVKMNGRAIFRFGVEQGGQVIRELMGRAGLTPDQVSWVIPHQANLRIIQALIDRSGIDAERWVVNIQSYGNTASASVPIALAELLGSGRAKPGDIVLLVAFGAGLTWSGLALQVGG